MSLEFKDFIYIIATIQFLLFSIFLLSLKKGKRLSNNIFAAFLLSKVFIIIHYLILQYKIYINFPHIAYIGAPFHFAFGPFLYFYTKSLAYKDFSFKKSHTIHFTPFILSILFMSYKFYFHSADTKRELIRLGNLFTHPEILFINYCIFIQVITYLIASMWILRNYRLEIKNSYSYSKGINLSWLSYLLAGFMVTWMIDFMGFFIWSIHIDVPVYLNIVSVILLFLFASYIIFRGLQWPELFTGIEEKPKYEGSTLTEAERELYLEKLRTYMEEAKPHLNPSLTINQLARKLFIPSRHLSQIINEHLEQNFFDFVNSYRIEEAKNAIKRISNGEKTILEIVFDVGFNSKSVFNRAFKKYTGMTPSEFKKSYVN